MSNNVAIVVLVEGPTEKIFIADIVVPHLAAKGVYITPIIISKPGQKGGDVKFARVKNDIGLHLKQRPDTYLTLFVDYYGIKNDWPGYDDSKSQGTPEGKAAAMLAATKTEVNAIFGEFNSENRFIPYVSMYEFEGMLFSETEKLAKTLQVPKEKIDAILTECGEPEHINDSPHTAPSKRIENLSARFKKTTTGIAIARAIGLQTIRERCPLFNKWLTAIEMLGGE